MHIVNPAGLVALVALPVIALIHLYRRRSPIRRVAGIFLWGAPTTGSCVASRRGPRWLTASLTCDFCAALLLTLLACDLRLGGSSPVGEPDQSFDTALRLVLCVAAAALVSVNWRCTGRLRNREEHQQKATKETKVVASGGAS